MRKHLEAYLRNVNSAILLLFCVSLFPLFMPVLRALFLELSLVELEHALKHSVVLSLSIFSIVFFSSLLVSLIPKARLILIFLMGILGFLALIQTLHYHHYQTGMGASVWQTILDSNTKEFLEYFLFMFGLRDLSLILLFVGVLMLIFNFTNLFKRSSVQFNLTFLLACSGLAGLSLVSSHSETKYWYNTAAFELGTSWLSYQAEIKWLQDVDERCEELISVPSAFPIKKELVLVIVGESTSIAHMSLYGYGKETNPRLSARAEELQVFKGVQTGHVHTNESLKAIFMNEGCSLIKEIGCAGYQTIWLSNQAPLGENERITWYLAEQADEQVFVQAKYGSGLDEHLLPEVKEIVNSLEAPTVLFVHLMGTHMDYFERYPMSFKHFDKGKSVFGPRAARVIDHYDNAVRYNDWIIDSLIEIVEQNKRESALFYFSDHGDEVYDFRDFVGHHQGLVSSYMTHVPFIYWSSTIDTTMREYFANEMELSSFSSRFKHWLKSENTGAIINEGVIREAVSSSLGVDSNHQPARVWAHRCNSVERINEIQEEFKGFELDLYWNGSSWEVNHPPAEGEPISLVSFFDKIETVGKSFWLDLKNPTLDNLEFLHEELAKIGVKDNFLPELIVETQDLSLLKELKVHGLRTAFYLPGRRGTNEELIASYSKLAQDPRLQFADFVSQEIWYLDDMERFFPNHQLLTWYIGREWRKGESRQELTNLLEKHPRVSVCLINYPSKNWR